MAPPLWRARAPPSPPSSTAPAGRSRSAGPPPWEGLRRSVSSAGPGSSPRTPGASGIAPRVLAGRQPPGSRPATLHGSTGPTSMGCFPSRLPAAHARSKPRGCCLPASVRPWPRPSGPWPAIRTLWGQRSDAARCCRPGDRRCTTIPTSTVWCLGAGCRPTGRRGGPVARPSSCRSVCGVAGAAGCSAPGSVRRPRRAPCGGRGHARRAPIRNGGRSA
jgi:hypothetical protein